MILIGTINLTRTREFGEFYCPTCGNQQEYRLRARRPFLTLYFIPVVPLGGAELFVDCRSCRDRWDVSVLTLDRKQHQEVLAQQFHDEVLRAAILVVLADGSISDSEIESLQNIASRMFGRIVGRDEIGELCSIAVDNRIEASNYLLSVSRRWSQQQRAEALQMIFLAVTADGEMGENQHALLAQLRDILEMTNQEYQAAIEAAVDWECV